MTMDIIFLKGLEIDVIIGIYDWERSNKQTIELDIEMAFDITKAAATDDIAYTLDYKQVSDRVTSFVENSEFFLVEKLIVQIADLIRGEFNVPWIRITLNKKGAVKAAQGTGIIIERGQK